MTRKPQLKTGTARRLGSHRISQTMLRPVPRMWRG